MAPKVELQEFEDRAALRVKFASLRGEGPHLVSDAVHEYAGFFDELPAGWSVTEERQVETSPSTSARRDDSPARGRRRGRARDRARDPRHLGELGGDRREVGFLGLEEVEGTARRDEAPRTAPPGGPGNDAVVFERTSWAADCTRTLSRVTAPADSVDEDLILRYLTGAAPQAA